VKESVGGLLSASGIHGGDLLRKKPGSDLRYREGKWLCTSFARFDSEEVTAIPGFRFAQSRLDIPQIIMSTFELLEIMIGIVDIMRYLQASMSVGTEMGV
jgi:hypothetical protein